MISRSEKRSGSKRSGRNGFAFGAGYGGGAAARGKTALGKAGGAAERGPEEGAHS